MPSENQLLTPTARRLSRRRLLGYAARGVAGILVTPLLSGCPSRTAQLAVVTVTGQNAFTPASLTISRGTKVVWKNGDSSPHTTTCDIAKAANGADVTLPAGASPWDSGLLYTGDTWARTFDTPGTYVYFSAPDEGSGMIGTITVRG